MAAGVLTKPEAREILASFFIKGCEWIQSQPRPGSGDAQHYQNIVLAGIDAAGREVTNDVTYLVLDIVEELAIADFPITVRLNSRSPERLPLQTAQVMRHGGGIVVVYNEDLILRALKNEGYPESEARSFANDGCWKSRFPAKPTLPICPSTPCRCPTASSASIPTAPSPLIPARRPSIRPFWKSCKQTVEQLYQSLRPRRFRCTNGRWRRRGRLAVLGRQPVLRMAASRTRRPTSPLASFIPSAPPTSGGAPDVANSPYALQKAVFEEKRLSLRDMVTPPARQLEGAEAQRLYRKPTMYITATIPTRRTLGIPVCLTTLPPSSGGAAGRGLPLDPLGSAPSAARSPGCPTERHCLWPPARRHPSGTIPPTLGTDSAGASHHPILLQGGFENNLRRRVISGFSRHPAGENGIAALKALLRGFVQLNGCFMQLNTVDAQTPAGSAADPRPIKPCRCASPAGTPASSHSGKGVQSMIDRAHGVGPLRGACP